MADDKDKKDDEAIPKVLEADTKTVSEKDLLDAADAIIEAAVKKAKSQKENSTGGNLGPDLAKHNIPSESEIREELAWVPDRYKEFLKPDPADFENLIKPVKMVANQFAYYGEDLLRESEHGQALDRAWYMGLKWKGVMADAFNEEFLEPMVNIMPNQGRLATVLHAEAEKAKEVYKLKRKNALKVAEDTVKAIEAIKKSKGADFDILIAVLITAGTFMTLRSPGVAFAGAAIAGGATMGGPFTPDDDEGEEVPLAADTVEQVIDNMKKALDKIEKSVSEEEDILIDAMKENEAIVRSHIGGSDKATALVPLKPEVATADNDAIKRRFVKFDGNGDSGGSGGNGDGSGGGGGGRGSYMGDDPPEDFEGSVNDTNG